MDGQRSERRGHCRCTVGRMEDVSRDVLVGKGTVHTEAMAESSGLALRAQREAARAQAQYEEGISLP